MHVILWAEDSETELRSELLASVPGATVSQANDALEAGFELLPGKPLPCLAFARQFLPQARPLAAESIRAWAECVSNEIIGSLPENQPWSLHVEPHYGSRGVHRIGARAWHSLRLRTAGGAVPLKTQRSESRDRDFRLQVPERGRPPWPSVAADAGRHRCRLIREAVVDLLRRKRRHLLRHLRHEPRPFTATDSLVQLLLTAPERGFFSVAVAPMAFDQRHLITPFPKGAVPMATDKAAPSRAFAKLVEAELRMGRAIQAGEVCVDLGAAPGSWSYVAANRRARVLAVDRSALHETLMKNRRVQFLPGDAFSYRPAQTVDWLLCDVIAPPERTAALLLGWLRQGWCRRFVVTLKLKGPNAVDLLTQLKRDLPLLTHELYLTRLCANKKEVCAFGVAKVGGSPRQTA